MKTKAILAGLFVLLGYLAQAQAFKGTYTIGNATFKAQVLSEEDQQDGLFNLVYSKGDPAGTMASLSQDPAFAYVFEEYEGDTYLGTFYFTKALKKKPMEGYYIRAKDKKKLPVKFLKE